MPKEATLETLSSCYISRIDRTIRLVESQHNKKARLRVYLMQTFTEPDRKPHREACPWLSQIAGDRIADLKEKLDVHEHELSNQFRAALLAWPHVIGGEANAAETVRESVGSEPVGSDTAGSETVGSETVGSGTGGGGGAGGNAASSNDATASGDSSAGGRAASKEAEASGGDAAFVLPATQAADEEEDEIPLSERVGSPVAMDLDAPDAADDIESSTAADSGQASASATSTERSVNRPVTRGAPKPIDRFAETKHSSFSAYENGRLGARHDRTRDVSYPEAMHRLEEMGLQADAWLHEVCRITTQMDIIVDSIPSEHAAVARALQLALMEMVEEAGDGDEDDAEDDAAEECAACEAEETEAHDPAAAECQTEAECVSSKALPTLCQNRRKHALSVPISASSQPY